MEYTRPLKRKILVTTAIAFSWIKSPYGYDLKSHRDLNILDGTFDRTKEDRGKYEKKFLRNTEVKI